MAVAAWIYLSVLMQLLTRSILCSSYLLLSGRFKATSVNGRASTKRQFLSHKLIRYGIPLIKSSGVRVKGSYLSAVTDEKQPVVVPPSVDLLSEQFDLVLPDFHIIVRTDVTEEIKHVDLYLRSGRGGLWWAFFIRFLPQFLRPKPSAKTGVRTYISSSGMMDQLVVNCFGENALSKECNDAVAREKSTLNEEVKYDGRFTTKIRTVTPTSTGSANVKWAAKSDSKGIAVVGLFVYMWITPMLRGRNLGDVLLDKGKELCKELGADCMILVHDDNGTGKLIDYYSKRGFRPIFDVIDKGMLGKLS